MNQADDVFDIPVSWKGQELHFPARLLVYGYTHKISVAVNGIEVLLEPDEERNYRAVVQPGEDLKIPVMDQGLLAAIVGVVESIVN